MTIRVMHCVRSLADVDGGPARSVPSLAQAVADAGCDVTIWTAVPPRIDVDRYPSVRFVCGELEGLLKDGPVPDLLHDHGVWLRNNHEVARASRRHRIRRIVTPRGMLQPWCLRHHRVRKSVAWHLYQNRDLKSADALHATSTAEAEQFRRLGFQQPTLCIPNGVQFPTASSCVPKASDDQQEALFLSRIHPKKGIDLLLQAWARLRPAGWRLRIVGNDEDGYRSVIEAMARRLGIDEQVVIEGPAFGEEKWERMSQASLFVLPSHSENFGIVVAESLAAGTPVVTTTETPWTGLRDRQAGWCVGVDIENIARALAEATSTPPAVLAAMGQRGRDWVREEFSWELIGRRMQTAYESLLESSARGQMGIPTEREAA
ncbi:MAG: glycosyltransferase [Planctomycetaceae bacterium]|nr:glycosyltransferase [Planctomycetaceae bacterium]